MLSKHYAYVVKNVDIKIKNLDEHIEEVGNKTEIKNDYSDAENKDGYWDKHGTAVFNGDTGSFCYTVNSIFVPKGYTIILTAKGYETKVCMIGEEINSSYNLKPLVICDDSTVRDYSYTATKDIYVKCCGNKNPGLQIKVFCTVADAVTMLKSSVNTLQDSLSATNYISMFHKIGVIGDSLSSGEIAYSDANGEHYIDRYESSWLSNIARKNGLEKVHYSQGGMTAKAWLNGQLKNNMISDAACNAYFIALATNDINQTYSMGTIDDDQSANTFAGYYKSIIDVVHNHAPNAAIFLVSTYTASEKGKEYSQVISDISDLYDYCFYVNFKDNTSITTNTGNPYSNYGHFTTQGYVIVADVIQKLVNKIVEENMNYFMFFSLNN